MTEAGGDVGARAAAVEVVEVAGRLVEVSNPDKVLFPDAGFTKRDLVAYYRAVAPALLPHLAGRALTLVRFPDGVLGKGWFQSNCRGAPDWLPIAPIEGKQGQELRYAVVSDEAALVWIANLATIELHPFLAAADRPAHPRAVVFDLDPGPSVGPDDLARVAFAVRDALAARGLAALVKTSGVKGLHLYAAAGGATYAETKALARAVAAELSRAHPARVTDRMLKAARAGRVFIDWSQNDPGKSTVAPYSLRALRVPSVSMPLAWDEVGVVRFVPPVEALARIAAHGDRFAEVA